MPISAIRPFAARLASPSPPARISPARTQDPGVRAYKSWLDKLPRPEDNFADFTLAQPKARTQDPGLRAYKSWIDQIPRRLGANFVDCPAGQDPHMTASQLARIAGAGEEAIPRRLAERRGQGTAAVARRRADIAPVLQVRALLLTF